MKYSAFFGRYQPWHDGHDWLIQERLKENKNVWIGVRDVKVDENNPFQPIDIVLSIKQKYNELVENGRILVTIIPDIESVNYGRGVGYDIIEHTPPKQIHDISATKLRKDLKNT